MGVEVKVLADSLSFDGSRLSTFQVRVPRVVWSEVMTHRAFSRNASSSRAIPVAKLIEDVLEDPYIPERFGLAKKGMQPGTFVSVGDARYEEFKAWWLASASEAVNRALTGRDIGLHKQVVNRILEPYQHINAVISATDWDNFIKLRTEVDDAGNPMADIPIYQLACAIRDELDSHSPEPALSDDWHIPFAGGDGWNTLDEEDRLKVAIARCARVSYVSHSGQFQNLLDKPFENDLELFQRLLDSQHLSPFEHVAQVEPGRFANFTGFRQYRWDLEHREV